MISSFESFRHPRRRAGRRRSVALGTVFLLLLGAAVAGQTQTEPGGVNAGEAPSFEVASVKPNENPAPATISTPRRGLVVATNVTLKALIEKAYSLGPHQLAGAPDWVARDRFDITARPPDDAEPGRALEMLKGLLAERFQLRVRAETAERPFYALVLAREDGRLGPALRASRHDCAAFLDEGGDPLSDSAPRDDRNVPLCVASGLTGRATLVRFGGATMGAIAALMEQYVDRPVVDETALPGTFDVIGALMFATPQGRGGDAFSVSDPGVGVSIFVALREQLGLELESRTGPIETLVIESVEPPTPD